MAALGVSSQGFGDSELPLATPDGSCLVIRLSLREVGSFSSSSSNPRWHAFRSLPHCCSNRLCNIPTCASIWIFSAQPESCARGSMWLSASTDVGQGLVWRWYGTYVPTSAPKHRASVVDPQSQTRSKIDVFVRCARHFLGEQRECPTLDAVRCTTGIAHPRLMVRKMGMDVSRDCLGWLRASCWACGVGYDMVFALARRGGIARYEVGL